MVPKSWQCHANWKVPVVEEEHHEEVGASLRDYIRNSKEIGTYNITITVGRL